MSTGDRFYMRSRQHAVSISIQTTQAPEPIANARSSHDNGDRGLPSLVPCTRVQLDEFQVQPNDLAGEALVPSNGGGSVKKATCF